VLRRHVRSRNIKNRHSIYIYDISSLRVKHSGDEQTKKNQKMQINLIAGFNDYPQDLSESCV